MGAAWPLKVPSLGGLKRRRGWLRSWKDLDHCIRPVQNGLGPLLCCLLRSWAAVEQLPWATSAVGEKTSLSVYGRAERGPGSNALNKHQILWVFWFTVMKHIIISRALWLPGREPVPLTIPPSHPAPPPFEPPPSGEAAPQRGVGVCGISPESLLGCLPPLPTPWPRRILANPLPGFISLSLLYSLWGVGHSWGWGGKILRRSYVSVAIFLVRAKCYVDPIFCGFCLQLISAE